MIALLVACVGLLPSPRPASALIGGDAVCQGHRYERSTWACVDLQLCVRIEPAPVVWLRSTRGDRYPDVPCALHDQSCLTTARLAAEHASCPVQP